MNDKLQAIYQIGPYRNRKDAIAAAQLRIDGTAPDPAGLAKRLAAAPMRPSKPQAPCDVGLFSDDADQLDLVEMCQDPADLGDE